MDCNHTFVNDGPRIPLRWGSAATQVCDGCGAWRQNRGGCLDEWRPPEELAKSFMDEEESYPRNDA